MALILGLIALANGVEISGYVEIRPYVARGDSLYIFGYNRGWLEFKISRDNYGAQSAFDYFVPYDTMFFVYRNQDFSISRLALWLGPENLRLTAGKQRLYWGTARVLSPLDIFNPTNFFEPGYERAGVNALMAYAALGQLTSIRGIYQPQTEPEKAISGLRVGSNFLRNDIGLDFFYRPRIKMMIFGAELAGERAFGYWGEFTCTQDDTLEYIKTALGIDYTFPFMVYAMAEYFYDASGEKNPTNYDYAKLIAGARTTLGQHYFYVSLGLTQNVLFRPTLSSVMNLSDRGFILIPNIYYGLLDNVDINTGMNLFFGPADSEFKNLSGFDGAVYIWAKVYF